MVTATSLCKGYLQDRCTQIGTIPALSCTYSLAGNKTSTTKLEKS